MAGITPVGISIALAVLVIGMLVLATIRCRGKPKQRAEKGEKAEIMKRLLALSERENTLAVKAPSSRPQARAPKKHRRTSNVRPKTTPKITLPSRSKS
jgi:hypothetical protein